MDIETIVRLLKNADFHNITVGNGFIEFDDPSCIYAAFDNLLNIGWVVILILTAIMLFGWAVLYIKNGVKIDNLFNNAKTVILIFCILSAVKPIVNVIYGDDLFARGCDRRRVSLSEVQELLDMRNQMLSKSDSEDLYEIFDVIDSGSGLGYDLQDDLYVEYVSGVATEDEPEDSDNSTNKKNTNCVYTSGNGLKFYTNPTTKEEKVKKCVFDKAIDYALKWEKGFQRTPNDPGNRICDSKMNPLKDENGNYLLGATNMGITTCASGLSVECIKNMTEKDARQYYWTNFYRKYGYYKLPASAIAAVMELAVGGPGTVAKELKEAANVSGCGSSPVVNDCTAKAVSDFINKHGVNTFYKNITTLRANKRKGKPRERALGVQSLSNAHKVCGG